MKKHRKKAVIVIIVLLVLAAAAFGIVILAGKLFTAQEKAVRSDWTMETGDVLDRNEDEQIEYAEAELGSNVMALQLVPTDIEEDGFTYYDEDVQNRLENALDDLKEVGVDWTADNPLIVLNPYGTGSNSLYLYFKTNHATQVTYTIHVDDDSIPDFTATAADSGGEEYTKTHEFQIIGLVPGYTNEVTLEMTGSWGNVRQTVTFSVDMPKTQSGYDTALDSTEGTSGEELSDGLYALMRVNGYLGYGFFFDNSGILRYEMVLEGYGMDRIIFYEDDIITSVSAGKLARINNLGKAEQIFELDGYLMHHDLGMGDNGEILVLAEEDGAEAVEDLVISVDIETGEVTELIDFKEVLSEYFDMTRPVTVTDDFFWQAGEWDWIHLNSLQYMEEDDSLIVSSRETSAIIKVTDIHGDPETDWIVGDERVWEDTVYSDLCLEQSGDFIPQYGQHCVEYLYDGEDEGVYYLAVYNNNYWSINSRDDFDLDVDESVGTDLYGSGDETSQVYIYKIDETARTYSLESSFDVPYSSIVSNGSVYGDTGHWIVNSGVANVFGEYDADGNLIREYEYECTMQNYRTFKFDFTGFWFQ